MENKNIGVFVFLIFVKKILLVKKAYNDLSWTLPGGAIKKGEHILSALKREIYEEIGIIPKNLPKFIASFYSIQNYSLAICFKINLTKKEVKSIQKSTYKTQEISNVKFFDIYSLPARISDRNITRIKFLTKHGDVNHNNFIEYP